jgi:hypothetical protein
MIGVPLWVAVQVPRNGRISDSVVAVAAWIGAAGFVARSAVRIAAAEKIIARWSGLGCKGTSVGAF